MMKMMVKLAVLLATLLLLTGAAFAQIYDCDCYEFTATKADDPSVQYTFNGTVCLDEENNYGYVCGGFDSVVLDMQLSLFLDSMRDQGLGYNDNCLGYFKSHGDDHYVITGISYCYGDRYTIRGHKTDAACPACVL
jgi:hypothetical protein